MVGIVSYGAYVPYHRLQHSVIAEAFGSRAAAGEKAVASFDEDSVSLGASAALDCLSGMEDGETGAVFFVTTTAPYAEKQSAAILAAALDLRGEVRAADLTGSLRAASSGLLAALDAVRGGTKRALLVAADCRLGAPDGSNEQSFGDGAAAFLIGQGEDVIANVIATHAHTHEQIGAWRSQGDAFVRNWEDRFAQNVYAETVAAAVKGVLEKSGLQPGDFAKVILAGPAPRAQAAVAAKLGFAKEQLQDPLAKTVGHAGVAQAPMMLAAALEDAQPGDHLLVVTFGEGADAIALQATRALANLPKRRAVSGHLEPKNNGLLYTQYLKWKGILKTEPARRPDTPRPSVTAMYRNNRGNLSLYGSKCAACGTPQFPKQRVCTQCQAKDRMEDYRFYGRTAKIATYTIDHLAASPASPVVFAVVDFDGGGRMMCEVTDCEPAELHIGMEMEMTFRRLYEAGGIHNYFWKAKPKRNGGERG